MEREQLYATSVAHHVILRIEGPYVSNSILFSSNCSLGQKYVKINAQALGQRHFSLQRRDILCRGLLHALTTALDEDSSVDCKSGHAMSAI